MSGKLNKYEYSYVLANTNPWLFDEAREFGIVYARDIKEARSLAWESISYEYTICGVREIYE